MDNRDLFNKLKDKGYSVKKIKGKEYIEKDDLILDINSLSNNTEEEFEIKFKNNSISLYSLDDKISGNFVNKMDSNRSYDQDLHPNTGINGNMGQPSGGMFIGGEHDLFNSHKFRSKKRGGIIVPPLAKFDPIVPETESFSRRRLNMKKYHKSGEPDPDHLNFCNRFNNDDDDSDTEDDENQNDFL